MKKLSEIFNGSSCGNLNKLFVLSSVWKDVVGEGLSAFTRPVRLTGRILTVFVLDPIWQQELHFIKHDILGRIPAELDIAEIKFVVRYFKKNEPSKMAFRELTQKEKTIIERLGSSINDENLKNAFSRAMENYFRNYSYEESLNLE